MTATSRQPNRRVRPVVGISLLAAALLVLMGVGLISGPVAISPADVLATLGSRLGLGGEPDQLTDSVLWAIRFPRVLSGLMVGAGLGAAAAALQGGFRNQLADPQLLGLSAAAGLGAVAGIALSPAGSTPWLMMVGAAGAAAGAAFLMRSIARRVLVPSEFILVGLALGLAMLAWLAVIVLAWDSPRVPTFTFWVFGGLSVSTWSSFVVAAPIVLVGIGIVMASARSLDLLSLGEAGARHVGVDVDRVIAATLLGVGLATGGAVGLGGTIGFVGLIAPPVLRRWIGPAHRWLIPASALGGAAIVVGADVLARTVAAPVEIPVGLFTAIIGAPAFVWLLTRIGRAYR